MQNDKKNSNAKPKPGRDFAMTKSSKIYIYIQPENDMDIFSSYA